MAQASIEPGNPLYEVVSTLDLSKVPEKLHCPRCHEFLLNAFKATCCDGALCEKCNSPGEDGGCPLCKHQPFLSNPSKAIRGTARAYLKNVLTNAESTKVSETPVPSAVPHTPTESEPPAGQRGFSDNHAPADPEAGAAVLEETAIDATKEVGDPGEDVVQSIEETQPLARRSTMESVSGNEHDDDIEIHVGPMDEPIDPSMIRQSQYDDENIEYNRSMEDPGSQKPEREAQNDTFSGMNDNNFSNMSNMNMGFMNPQQMMQNMQMMMNGFNNSMPGFPMNFGQNFNPMMMGFGNMNEMIGMNQGNFQGFAQNMWNNDGFSNNMPQQFSQFSSGDYSNWQNFDGRGRGRGRKFRGRGRGNFGYHNQGFQNTNEPYQNGFQNFQNQQMQQYGQINEQPSTNDREAEQNPEDDDFAPAGQDEVREALGDKYETGKPVNIEESTIDRTPEVVNAEKKPQDQPEPSIEMSDQPEASIETNDTADQKLPAVEVEEKDIPEAYREDLEMTMAPPSAPLGPASKDYSYRSRGHGRYASRGGRGSFQGANGHYPISPIKPVAQVQAESPTSSKNAGLGVVGAPTGPKAMREKEPSAPKQSVKSNGDTGFKIVGRAAMQSEETQREESRPRSVTPRSINGNYDDREKDVSRKQSKHESRRASTKYDDYEDDHDRERDRRRRQSRRDDQDEYDTREVDQDYSRSNSSERKTSYRSSRRERDKEREKYSSSSSKYKSSSRRYEDADDDHEMDGYGEPIESKSHRSSKRSSKYDDRDKDYERSDKYRKRSRHDRDLDDGYEDVDEDESRQRSRKHRKEHHSSRRDKDLDHDDTDLGMRISGRSTSHRISEAPKPSTAATEPDKDPHTLEREARNRERMLKEEQRRQKAAQGLSGGRRVSYKYEDEIERGMSKPSRRR